MTKKPKLALAYDIVGNVGGRDLHKRTFNFSFWGNKDKKIDV